MRVVSQRRRAPYIAVANVPHFGNVEATKRGAIRLRTSLLVQNLGTPGATRRQGGIVGAKIALHAVAGPLRKDVQDNDPEPPPSARSMTRNLPFLEIDWAL